MTTHTTYAVAGVTGNTGKVAAETLLERGAKVRVIVRDKAKGNPWMERGAEVAVADLGDATALTEALRDTAGAYLLSPPDFATDDFLASRRTLVDTLADAVTASGVPHVVFLSSIGAQNAEGTGVIRTVHYGEEKLGGLEVDTTFLRPAFFIENWGAVLPMAMSDGVLHTMFRGDLTIPMVATRDVGLTAAEVLLSGPKGRRHVIELAGPKDASPEDVAAALGEVLGRTITVGEVPHEAQVPTLTSMGLRENLANLFFEMNRGIDSRQVNWEGKGADYVRGKTTIGEVLLALVAAAGT